MTFVVQWQDNAYYFEGHNRALIAILPNFFPSRQGIVQSQE